MISWKLRKFRELALKRMNARKEIAKMWDKAGGFKSTEDALHEKYKKDRPDVNSLPF